MIGGGDLEEASQLGCVSRGKAVPWVAPVPIYIFFI